MMACLEQSKHAFRNNSDLAGLGYGDPP